MLVPTRQTQGPGRFDALACTSGNKQHLWTRALNMLMGRAYMAVSMHRGSALQVSLEAEPYYLGSRIGPLVLNFHMIALRVQRTQIWWHKDPPNTLNKDSI